MNVVERRMLGVKIGARTLAELRAASMDAVERRSGAFVFACANPHSLVVASRDADFRAALDRASAVVADGVGCSLAASLVGVPVGPRITGSDYFVAILAALSARGGRAFFFGSSDDVLGKLEARVAREFPGVSVRTLSPPFRAWSEEENQWMIAEIRRFAPDLLCVGMTAPKQEKWVAANIERLGVPVIASIGAVFDYYAGVTRRAPPWVCRLGLEWLYRLPGEPRRLWRRTFVSAPQFLWLVVRERFSL